MRCIICTVVCDPKKCRTFPDIGTAKREEFCNALGVPVQIFDNVDTRRYICMSHFEEEDFEIKKGERVLKHDAYPKLLTAEEKRVLEDTVPISKHRKPKTPNQQPSNFTLNILSPPTASSPSSSTATVPKNKNPPKYVIVELDNLLPLLQHCTECGHVPDKATPTVKFIGSACKSKLWCNNCNKYVSWESQKKITGRKLYSGNVEIAAAMSATPIALASFLQFAQILNLAMFGSTSYYKTLIPSFWNTVCKTYDKMQKKVVGFLVDKNKTGIPVNLAADGQFDSRGFSALMCCVTIMDAVTKLIVTIVCLNKQKENCPSTHLECKGLEKGLKELHEKNVVITSLTTDRSKSVISLMQTTFPEIRHFYDLWHVIKGIANILRLECKNKRAARFKEYCQALLNHLWYSVSTAKGDGALCQEYAVSALLHTIDIHQWPSGSMSQVLHDAQATVLDVDSSDVLKNDPLDLISRRIHELEFQNHLGCGHADIENREKIGLDPNSKSYQVLQKTFTSDSFLNDVKNLSPEFATSALEGFQGLVTNKYRSKNSYFDPKSFEEKTKLAVLHYNNNRLDEMEGRRKVRKVYTRSAKHRGGEMVKKNLKTATDYTWKIQLIKDTIREFENKNDISAKEDEEIEESENEEYEEETNYEEDEEEYEADVESQINQLMDLESDNDE